MHSSKQHECVRVRVCDYLQSIRFRFSSTAYFVCGYIWSARSLMLENRKPDHQHFRVNTRLHSRTRTYSRCHCLLQQQQLSLFMLLVAPCIDATQFSVNRIAYGLTNAMTTHKNFFFDSASSWEIFAVRHGLCWKREKWKNCHALPVTTNTAKWKAFAYLVGFRK